MTETIARLMVGVAIPAQVLSFGSVSTQPEPPSVAPPCFNQLTRYVNCGNGTVTDTVTGLTWLRNADCFGHVDWATGNSLAAVLQDGQCDLTDGSSPGHWRLPSLAEWRVTTARARSLGCSTVGDGSPPSLTNDEGTACLAEGPTSFAGIAHGSYWSRSANEEHPNNAWVWSLDGTLHGHVYSSLKSFRLPVWPVRAGSAFVTP